MTRKDVDSGWAWVVLVASYMNLFILSGVCYIGGMFQVVFLEEFQESVGLTAWVTSLYTSLMLLSGLCATLFLRFAIINTTWTTFEGPLTSVIIYKLNCRSSVVLGGLLLGAGLAASSFTTSLSALFVTFGVVAGLGLGLCYTPSVVVVNFYFEKKRTLVTSVALSASGTGLLVAPLLFRYLLDNFAWQECLLILAGICIHVTLFGALMFPIHEGKKQKERRSSGGCPGNSQQVIPASDGIYEIASSQLLTETANSQLGYTSTSCNSPGKDTSVNVDEMLAINHRDSKTKTIEDECEKLTNNLKSDEVNIRAYERNGSQLDIFRNRAFIIFLLHTFLVNAGCGIFNIHLPAFCESYGSTTMQVALVMSVNGPANMVSRVLLGAFAHVYSKDVWVLYYGVLLVTSTVLCFMPTFAGTYTGQLIAVVLIGTYLGGSYALPPVLTLHCVGLSRLASAFGVTMICSGLGWLVAPPVAGWIVDVTLTYDSGMYLAGAVIVSSVLVGLVVPQLIRPGDDDNCHG